MYFKQLIIAFFLTILCGTFAFSYFSLPNNQFIEIAEEENKSSSSLFSVEEYISDEAEIQPFSYTKFINYFSFKNTITSLTKEVIAPPPKYI